MIKRAYDIFKYQNNSISLMISFFDPYYQTLCEFFDAEVDIFYPHIYKELEAVVTGQKEASGFGGNMLNIDIGKEETDESLGEPCFIPTNELYKLVLEWKEMEDRMHRGEDIFPVMIED